MHAMKFRNVTLLFAAAASLAGCDALRQASYKMQNQLVLYPTDAPATPAQPARASRAQPAAASPATPAPLTAAQAEPPKSDSRKTVTVRGATNATPEAQREADLQRELVAQNWLEERRRLIDVGTRIMRANTEICGQYLASNIGLYLLNNEAMGRSEYTSALARAGNVDARQYIFVVPQGSSIEAAGLRERDRLISVDGWQIPDGRSGMAQLGERIGKRGPLQPMPVVFERNGETFSTEVTPQIGCSGIFILLQSPVQNAVANGHQVGITTGMMRFTRTDDELALVLAHEMAHNILRHPRQFRDGLKEDVAAARRGEDVTQIIERRFEYRQQNEREADYYGLYLAHRAGYAIDGATAFWRRRAIENPGGIEGGLTHPTTADRVVGIENTLTEIGAKQVAGQPLRPVMDGDKVVLPGPASAGTVPVALKTPAPPASSTAVSAMPVPAAPPPKQQASALPATMAPTSGPQMTLLPETHSTQAEWTAQRSLVLRASNQSYTPPIGYKEPEQPADEGTASQAQPGKAQTAPVQPAAQQPRAARTGVTPTAPASAAAPPNPAAMTPAAPVAASLPAGYKPSASVVDRPADAAEQQKLAAATGAQPTPPEMAGGMTANSMTVATSATPAPGWKAHLASHRTESAAINEWQELLKANATLYGQYDPLVEWTDTQRGAFARLVLVGFADRKAADDACAKIRSSTRYCASVQ